MAVRRGIRHLRRHPHVLIYCFKIFLADMRRKKLPIPVRISTKNPPIWVDFSTLFFDDFLQIPLGILKEFKNKEKLSLNAEILLDLDLVL